MKRHDKLLNVLAAVVWVSAAATVWADEPGQARPPAPAASIRIDASKHQPAISRRLFGKFTEHLAANVYLGAWAQVVSNPQFAPAARWKDRNALAHRLTRDGLGDMERLRKAIDAGFPPHWFGEGKVQVQLKSVPGPRPDQDALEVTTDADGGAIATAVYLPVWRTRRCELTLTVRGPTLDQTKPAALAAQIMTVGGKLLGQAQVRIRGQWMTTTTEMDLGATDEDVRPGQAVVLVLRPPKGQVQIARVLLFPADHVQGWDPEIVDHLRQTRLPLLRFPGGNFASGYHWKDGIGPAERRPVRPNPAWGDQLEWNHVGTDEWLRLCEAVGAEPMICVNAGDGTADEARQWVEYCNAAAETEMGKLRAANGHPKPYNVRVWEVGNELYGGWQIGHTDAAGYAERYGRFAQAMRQADASIELIANGNDARWNAELVRQNGPAVRSVSAHFLIGSHIPREADPKEVFKDFMAWTANFGREIEPLYRPMVQAGLKPHLAVTELMMFTRPRNLPRNDTQSEAVWLADIIHASIRSGGIVELITHSALVNHGGGLAKRQGIVYAQPVWHATHLYAGQDGTVPADVQVQSPTFEATGRWLGRRGPVASLDAVALLNQAGARCSLFVINRHPDQAMRAEISLASFTAGPEADVVTLAGESFLSTNTVDNPGRVHPVQTKAAVAEGKLTHEFPPASVTRITMKRQ